LESEGGIARFTALETFGDASETDGLRAIAHGGGDLIECSEESSLRGSKLVRRAFRKSFLPGGEAFRPEP
jgi:hypothetical protein